MKGKAEIQYKIQSVTLKDYHLKAKLLLANEWCRCIRNFTKFLIDKNGNVVRRFEPTEGVAVVEEAVKELV